MHTPTPARALRRYLQGVGAVWLAVFIRYEEGAVPTWLWLGWGLLALGGWALTLNDLAHARREPGATDDPP